MKKRDLEVVAKLGALQINTPAAVETWTEAKADEVFEVLADVGRGPGALSAEVERKIARLHAAAVELRDAARDERDAASA